jgi:hypothetical protein
MKPAPRALQFRNVEGEVLGSSWGGTTCLNPRTPSKYAAVSEDGRQEHEIPCRDCAGCREFLRRELCKRLTIHFGSHSEEIWLVIVEAPLSLHSLVSARLRRAFGGVFEPAFYRLGDSMFALIALGRSPRLSAWSTRAGYAVSTRRVQRGRGKRAWNLLTWGILTPRAHYSPNCNRYYHRGLPRAERLKWNVRMRGGIKARNPWVGRGVIAVRGGVGLFRGERATLPRMKERTVRTTPRAAAPESVGAVLLGMMDRNYAPVPERGLPVNSGRPQAGLPSSMTEFRNAPALQSEGPTVASFPRVGRGLLPPAPTAAQEPNLREPKGRRYASSLTLTPADFIAWGQRMADKARMRGG